MPGLVLELYRPEQLYLTPNNGETIIPLNSTWTNQGITFNLDDNVDLDMGSLEPEINMAQVTNKYGNKYFGYGKRDRVIKFQLIAQATSSDNLRKGIRNLEAVLHEATQYSTNPNDSSGNGKRLGEQIFLKYQPSETQEAVYFQVKTGFIDTSKINEQLTSLQNMAYIPVTIITSYAAYGEAVILVNLAPNGDFLYGTKYWAQYSIDVESSLNTNVLNYNTTISDYTNSSPVNGSFFIGKGHYNSTTGTYTHNIINNDTLNNPEFGSYETYLPFINPSTPDDYDFLYLTYRTSTSLGYKGIYSYPIDVTTGGGGIALKFDYYIPTGVAANNVKAYLQYWNGTTWTNLDSVNLAAGTSSWQTYKSTIKTLVGNSTISKVRCRFSFNGFAIANGTDIYIKDVAIWYFPANSGIAKIPTTEYVSQTYGMNTFCVLRGLRGTLETSVRTMVYNPSTNVYQKVSVGGRKKITDNYSLRNYYNSTAFSMAVGTNITTALAPDTNKPVAVSDSIPKAYKVYVKIATNQPVGLALGASATNTHSIVPNSFITEIPNTGGVAKTIDCGKIVFPSVNMYPRIANFSSTVYVTRVPTTDPTVAVSGTLYDIWFLPADELITVDTRQQSGLVWATITSGSYKLGNLVLDSLMREDLEVFLNSRDETNPVYVAPSYNNEPVRFYPQTITSPSPMIFGSVVFRTGASGLPSTDIVDTDPVMLGFIYCPAYDF